MDKVTEAIKRLNQQGARQPRVIIMGAGMSGILMGIRLLNAGLSNFTIYEKTDRIGGTWRENTYPGIACDIPSYFYTYSFEVNPNWSHRFPPGAEIQRYFETVFNKYKLAPRTRFNEEIINTQLIDGQWHIETANGLNDSADFLVAATGVLHKINQPSIQGLDSFEGPKFHTARWDHGVDLKDKRVGIIGSGSTAIQTIDPLSKLVSKLTLFQRTAQWVFPLPDKAYSATWIKLATRFPFLGKSLYKTYKFLFEKSMGIAVTKPCLQRSILTKLCHWNLARVKDLELRKKLTPDYLPGCKRLVMSMPFYSAIQKPNCSVVTEQIEKIESNGVRTKDGQLHELDVLVLATGFDGFAFMRPMSMQGLNGLTLDDAWKKGPQALRAMAIPGFPNFFMLIGPHSPIGNHSLIAIAETQTHYIMQCIEKYMQGDFDFIEAKQQAVDDFYTSVNEALPNTIWTTGCQSWYLDDKGIPGLWPWSPQQYAKEMKVANFSQYHLTKA